MIQAPLPKPIEMPKAQPKPAAHSDSSSNVSRAPKAQAAHKEAKANKKEFARELDANMNEGDVEVKPVEVSAEQNLEKPSSLVQPNGSVETTTQKIFDPNMTKDVDALVAPKTSEVTGKAEVAGEANVEAVVLTDEQVLDLANAKPEVMNTKALSGRAPALDFAKAEIDPQLLSNEDFVAQKNLVTNKKPVPNAYGMKPVPVQQQKAALEAGLQQTQVVKDATATSAESSPMNSQQFILGLQTEAKTQATAETQATTKVFDMSSVKSSQPSEIMNQITDYVVQAKAAKEPTVNMRVKHDDLGMIDITVSKIGIGQDAIAVNIGTHSVDGKNFFQQNSKDLFSHLTNAGLNISDIKVETPAQTAKSDFDFGSQQGRNSQSGSERQFGSEQNQRRHDSDRRQELWKLLNKEAA